MSSCSYSEQYQQIVQQVQQQPLNQPHLNVKMPRIVDIPPNKQLFKKCAYKQDQNISESLKKNFQGFQKELNCSFKIYQQPQKYNFQFPESKFPQVMQGQENDINYQQKTLIEDQDTFQNSLSAEQLQQIWETGSFKVQSKIEYITLPYVWKINDLIFRGRQTIIRYWRQGICNAYGCLCQARKLIIEVLPKTVYQFTKYPSRLFSLLFGRAKRRKLITVNCELQVIKEFWQDVINNHYVQCKEWGSELWEYLRVNYRAEIFEVIELSQDLEENKRRQKQKDRLLNEYNGEVRRMQDKKNRIMQVHNEFQKYWGRIKKRTLQEISQNQGFQLSKPIPQSEEQKTLEELMLKELQQRKYKMYLKHLNQKLPEKGVPESVIEAIITLLYILRIVTDKTTQFYQKKQKLRLQCIQDIAEKYKIRSQHHEFSSKKLKEQYNPKLQEMTNKFYQDLFQQPQIKQFINAKQKEVYKLYVDFQKTFKDRVQAKAKQMKVLEEPQRVFYSSYRLLPPYQLQGKRGSYSLKKEQGITIDTSYNFWKLRLYAMRIKSWTINCVVFLIYHCWKGPFGIRRLYGIDQFNYEHVVNYRDGTLSYTKKKPLLGHFMKVLSGVKASRQNFEAQPDKGLFGKNLIRVINYAQCYIFRFLFVGVFLVLLCYPCLIVLNSLITTVLIVFFWLWVPLVIMVTYLFNILVFQFESSWIPNGVLIRSIPLLSLLLSIVSLILRILFYMVSSLILLPVSSLIVALFSLFMRYYRTLTDLVVILLIGKLGRTPSKNSAVAKKISGPGMSRNYYMSINEEDIYILTQAELQKLQMHEIQKHTRNQINALSSQFNNTLATFLNALQAQQKHNQKNIILQNANLLTQRFNKQFHLYMARYPKRPRNIRFTQEEIDTCFDNCEKIVKSFILKRNLGNWIFEKQNLLEGTYDELTRILWINIFGCGEQIFEPLQKLDERFKVQDQYRYEGTGNFSKSKKMKMKKSVHSVMDAIQGQVQLSQQQARLKPYQHQLINRDVQIYDVSNIMAQHSSNCLDFVNLPFQQPQCLFIPHLTINELIKKQHNDRQNMIKQNQTRIIWQ